VVDGPGFYTTQWDVNITGGHGGLKLKADYRRIAARRGTRIARVAVARKLLTLVYFGLRDGEVRCLARAAEVA
jgi:hypothetical protein